jgi:hypothetical protein
LSEIIKCDNERPDPIHFQNAFIPPSVQRMAEKIRAQTQEHLSITTERQKRCAIITVTTLGVVGELLHGFGDLMLFFLH